MDAMTQIKHGLWREEQFLVEEQHTAYHIGSGDERVLGTPWMISFMERVSNRLILERLPEGYMSVGFHLDVKHLAPTPMKSLIRVRVEIIDTSKKRVMLRIEAWDQHEKIGEGRHVRVVVERAPFMEKAKGKGVIDEYG